MKVVITGGSGFVGHHVIEHILLHTKWEIDIVDKLTYASLGFERLKSINAHNNKRIRFFTYDFTNPITDCLLSELNNCDYILHLGAETHVDNSITNPQPFVLSNVVGTMNVLEFAKNCKQLKKMIYASTDEVFGPASKIDCPNGYSEWDRYNSTNPYSATKAAAEELCLAWANTYKVPVIIIHTMNIFAERQHKEKFIPKTIKNILENNKIYIHADSTKTIPGSRYWIHARNVAAAILFILDKGQIRDKYNIVGEKEVNNLELAQFISDIIGKPLNYELVDFHSSRPGHDLRYALNGDKLKSMGFTYPKTLESSLQKTIEWTLDHLNWLD